jgi:eukaryotic-like serine/threonine-protein kinase
VHRDIKPANIMYEFDSDTVKVTDFGIARITDSSKTKTGLVLGTPSFMSPEQIAGKKVDGRSDLYSLGVMLFQMLTGVLPFRGDSMAELMYKIANEEAPDIRIIRPDISERLANVVALSLAKRPESCYQSGDQFAADLRSLLGEVNGAPADSGFGAPTSGFGPVLRSDSEVASPAGADKTAVMSAPRAPKDYEATVVGAVVPGASVPGYDPGHPTGEASVENFAKTAVIRKPAEPGSSGAGDDKKDLEG